MEEKDTEVRLSLLEQQDKNHSSLICELKKLIEILQKEIKDIRERLLGRPSWWVVLLITGLASMVSALSIYIITL